ncbi:MAG: hypothetical protein V5A55_05980 [Halovenus sp.]
MAGSPSFAIPSRPERRFPRSGGVEYEGGAVFSLTPTPDQPTERLETLVADVLAAGPYRYGDFRAVPMALYLVRDEETGDVFRVSIRDGTVRLHVLPETESAGLRAFYERVDGRTEAEWIADCQQRRG